MGCVVRWAFKLFQFDKEILDSRSTLGPRWGKNFTKNITRRNVSWDDWFFVESLNVFSPHPRWQITFFILFPRYISAYRLGWETYDASLIEKNVWASTDYTQGLFFVAHSEKITKWETVFLRVVIRVKFTRQVWKIKRSFLKEVVENRGIDFVPFFTGRGFGRKGRRLWAQGHFLEDLLFCVLFWQKKVSSWLPGLAIAFSFFAAGRVGNIQFLFSLCIHNNRGALWGWALPCYFFPPTNASRWPTCVRGNWPNCNRWLLERSCCKEKKNAEWLFVHVRENFSSFNCSPLGEILSEKWSQVTLQEVASC